MDHEAGESFAASHHQSPCCPGPAPGGSPRHSGGCPLRGPQQRQSHAALRNLGHRRHKHPGCHRRRRGPGPHPGRRWDLRRRQPGGVSSYTGQTDLFVEPQRSAIKRHRRRRRPWVHPPGRRGGIVGVHFDQRHRGGVLSIDQRPGDQLYHRRQFRGRRVRRAGRDARPLPLERQHWRHDGRGCLRRAVQLHAQQQRLLRQRGRGLRLHPQQLHTPGQLLATRRARRD